MTNRVSLRPHNFIPYTLVPNFFIDGSLAKANGEFVKVYLVLLRYMSVGQLDFDLHQIADHLMLTESDVLRALNYFQSENLLTLTYAGNRLQEIHLNSMTPPDGGYRTQASDSKPEYGTGAAFENNYSSNGDYAPVDNNYNSYQQPQSYSPQQVKDRTPGHLKVVSDKPAYTNKEMAVFAQEEDFSQLLYIVQKYLGKTLSESEVKTIISFHDWLGLPLDVIELMIEYCVDNDHRNMRYIEKVAIDWADNGINTLEKAKVRTETYNRSYFVILKAYGITDRSPTPNQIKLMDKWLNEYHLDISVIVEACERTIAQINKAEMRYTDSILETWFQRGVKTLKDVEEQDKERPKKATKKPSQPSNNKFNGYNQRQYDYDELEKRALELRLKESAGKRYSS